jgi:uncharacterized protein with PIN domain
MKKLFLTDRMLGTLARYLRFMDYDTLSADTLEPGNTREDTVLLLIARSEGRILLTRDRELSRRGEECVFMVSEDTVEQVGQLVGMGLVEPDLTLKMHRCSVCNTILREAKRDEIEECSYAPIDKSGKNFGWCPVCGRLFWMGSHASNLEERLKEISPGKSK